MYVVKPLADGAKPKAFLTPKAAQEWAETDAYREFGADTSEIYWAGDNMTPTEAIAAVNAGLAERRITAHRRMSAQEIEDFERREAEAFLRDIGL